MFYSCERSSEPRLESKQTTLSSYHCSQHTGFIATLISMATTHSVVSAQQRLSVRACCVSYSTNVLILCYVRQSEESYSWKFNSRLTSSYFEATDAFFKSGFQALTDWGLYTKLWVSTVTSQGDERNGTIMVHTDALSLYICCALQCRSICIITHSHQELHIASHSPIPSHQLSKDSLRGLSGAIQDIRQAKKR